MLALLLSVSPSAAASHSTVEALTADEEEEEEEGREPSFGGNKNGEGVEDEEKGMKSKLVPECLLREDRK